MKRSFSEVPHPYILNPPHTSQEVFEPGDTFSFELVLFGKAIDYLPYFLFVFIQLGEYGLGRERGRFSVESVRNEMFGEEAEVYSSRTNCLSGDTQIYTSENFSPLYQPILSRNPDEITIRLHTPFRLKLGGRLRDDFTFFDFLRILLNRLYLLTYFHCGNQFDRDHRDLLEMSKEVEINGKNLHWQDWVRYSSRQKTKMKMGGVMGEFTLKGELTVFLPFLKIGEFIHVGKSTSMGLGKYEVRGYGNIHNDFIDQYI